MIVLQSVLLCSVDWTLSLPVIVSLHDDDIDELSLLLLLL